MVPEISAEQRPGEGDDGSQREIAIRTGKLDFRLLVDRHNRHIRLIDFRAGSYRLKRVLIDRHVRLESITKVYAFVERDEMRRWREVGFVREGIVANYYGQADALILSRNYGEEEPPLIVPSSGAVPLQAGVAIDVTTDQALHLITLLSESRRKRAMAFTGLFKRGSTLSVLPQILGEKGLVNYITFEVHCAYPCTSFSLAVDPEEADVPRTKELLKAALEEFQRREILAMVAICPSTGVINGIYEQMGFRRTARMNGLYRVGGALVNMNLWCNRLRRAL